MMKQKKEQKHLWNTAGIAWFSYEEEVQVNNKEQKLPWDNAGIASAELRGCCLPTRVEPKLQKKRRKNIEVSGIPLVLKSLLVFLQGRSPTEKQRKKKVLLERTKRLRENAGISSTIP